MRTELGRRKWLLLLLAVDIVLLCVAGIGSQTSLGESNMMQSNSWGVHAQSEGKKIALTFDDGPNHIYTDPLLDGLKERGVKATFFLIGNEVTKYPEIARRIAQEGHVIGNHSFYHVDLSLLSEDEAILQVARTNEVIYEATGQYPQFLRPPFGKNHPTSAYEPPMIEVLWTVDSRDWELDDVATVMGNVLPVIEDNSIILMHDASSTSVAAALAVVDCLMEEGYMFVTLDEILFP